MGATGRPVHWYRNIEPSRSPNSTDYTCWKFADHDRHVRAVMDQGGFYASQLISRPVKQPWR